MELLTLRTQNDDKLRDIFFTSMKEHDDIYSQIPTELQLIAQMLYTNTGLSQRTFYDELVTCHCVFKPISVRGNTPDPLTSTEFNQDGIWNHIVVINRTGEYTSFYKEGIASDISSEAHIRIIKQSNAYRAALHDIGFSRISTPSRIRLDGVKDDIAFEIADIEDQSVNGLWRIQAPFLFKGPSTFYNAKNTEVLHEKTGYPANIVEWGGKDDGNDRFYDAIGSFIPDVCQGTVNAILNVELGKKPWGVRHVEHIHLTRFQTILTAYGIPTSVIRSLAEQSVELRQHCLESIYEDIRETLATNMEGINWVPKSFGELDDYVRDAYINLMIPTEVKHFILAGRDNAARQGRLQFIHQTYAFAFGDTLKEQLSANVKSNSRILTVSRDILASDMKWDVSECAYHTMNITKEIDRCKYPYQAILERFGVNGDVSNKEFQYALRLHSSMDPVVNISMREALALSKIPKTWIEQKDGGHVYTKSTLLSSLTEVDIDLLHSMHPFLVNTGIKIAQAHKLGDKSLLKNISRDWAWLAKSSDGPLHALQRMNDKFDISASLKDFHRLIHQLTEAVLFRAIKDMPRSSYYEPLGFDNGNLNIDFQELFLSLSDYQREYDAKHTVDDSTYSNASHESVTKNFSSTHSRTTSFDIGDVKDSISKHAHDFKGALEMNSRLHKEYNKLIQRMNEYSSHQFSWQAFLSEPSQLDDKYTIHNINDRLSLLEEGSVMGHCVFSYMSACMSGNSVILSLKDSANPDIRIATIELSPPDEGKSHFELNQCYGHYNTEVSADVSKAVKRWVAKLNAGEISYTLPEPDGAEQVNVFEDVKNDPLTHGAKASSIPYDTDAIYEAIYAIERSLPHMSIPEIFGVGSKADTLTYLCEQSPFFKRGYFPLKALSQKYEMNIDVILAAKIKINAEWFDMPVFDNVLPQIQRELSAFLQYLHNEIGKISPPDGKALGADELRCAQIDYATKIQQCKINTLTYFAMGKGAHTDSQHIETQLLAHAPIERIFSEIMTPIFIDNCEPKTHMRNRIKHE